MFRTKICGVTQVDDALSAVAETADAIGLNFYSKSPRCVKLERAAEIARAVGGKIQIVGVFVNSYKVSIEQLVTGASLTAVQLHGDEPPEFLAKLHVPRIVKVFRAEPDWISRGAQYLRDCKAAGRVPDAILVDSPAAGSQYGGTGVALDWKSIPASVSPLREAAGVPLPILLAGGLTPHNVRQAILDSRADGVDVASGVETQPGIKSRDRVREFIRAAQQGFSEIAGS